MCAWVYKFSVGKWFQVKSLDEKSPQDRYAHSAIAVKGLVISWELVTQSELFEFSTLVLNIGKKSENFPRARDPAMNPSTVLT